ncbi:GNAT family N-acetyltransferase [Amycolatopsis decaplanina]|uniref:GCN5-related N-acetyltransferase n=1 Tax=Amycolatopsis decaplanina DSM 44594 TaxID=1284240 RepID=M2Z5Z2_9PSEU|nr:GNAT family N-acetyltransferase [Amycolatopsis decaplanina]EME62657.1 GCN5-related N-acetyltransferase [Amycolatopsis decaplanina DSM 44594]
MPLLIEPALPTGTFRSVRQPCLIVDDRLVLRPWCVDDAEDVVSAFACPAIQRWHVRCIDGADEAHEWIAGWEQRWTDETDASWAVVDAREDRPIGQVGLRAISLFEASAQLSYWVLPAARGAGIAGGAVAALTRWAFETVRLNRLFLLHSTANAASCRVAGKAGYALEGTLRSSMLHADGWHDVHLHARLRSESASSATGRAEAERGRSPH